MTEYHGQHRDDNEPRVVYVQAPAPESAPAKLSTGAHMAHLAMTLLTGGLWLPVWIIHAAIAYRR